MIKAIRDVVTELAFATPLLGAFLRDLRDGPDGSLLWLVFNLFGLALIALMLGGWPALSLVVMAATAVMLLLFFWNT
ncbi:MAG: hypothetical protein AAGC57_19315 [Pseudomonadota bacterium]